VVRFQKIENTEGCLKFLDERGVNLLNIHAPDIVDGNLKTILALCHALRLRFDEKYMKKHYKKVKLPWNLNNPSPVIKSSPRQPVKHKQKTADIIQMVPTKQKSNIVPVTMAENKNNKPKKTSDKGYECGYHGYYNNLFSNRNIGGFVILFKEDMAVLSWVQKLLQITIPDYTMRYCFTLLWSV